MLKGTNETITSRSDDFENVIASFQQRLEAVDVLQNRLGSLNFIKQRVQHRCFPLKFAKLLRTPSFTELLWWLFLKGYDHQVWKTGLASDTNFSSR